MVYSPQPDDPMSRLSQLNKKIDEIGRRTPLALASPLANNTEPGKSIAATAAAGTGTDAAHWDHVHTSQLSAQLDVNLSTPTSGQLLTYNGTQWTNKAAYTAGSGVLISGTNVVSADTSVVATVASLQATGLGRAASLADTNAQLTITGGEVILVSLTFNATTGRRYKIENQIWFDVASSSAGTYNVRYASGSSVTTSGTLLEGFPVGMSGGLGQVSSTFIETTAFGTGTYTVGLFGIRTLGSGSVIFRNGTTNPTRIYIEDVGT